MDLRLRPISIRDACEYVALNHRHNKPPQGAKFAVAVERADDVCGLRVCTDGTKNACSMLYGACARAAKGMGYREIVTYIMESEDGRSLRASGWEFVAAVVAAKTWSRDGQGRGGRDDAGRPTCAKQRWHCRLGPSANPSNPTSKLR